MKIFLSGATGAIGNRLVPLLVSAGHQVVGVTRTAAKAGALRAAGAEPVVADVLNRTAIRDAVLRARPDAVIHQATALAHMGNPKHFDKEFELTNRLRTEGTEHLLAAARESGTSRFLAQSYAGWPNERSGGSVKVEEDPLDSDPPASMRRTQAAIRQLETMVLESRTPTGTVLRFGSFYGPGTSMGEGGEVLASVRRRRFPIFGSGAGVWSFLHIDDAAAATLLALERTPAGLYNIVDDEPARVSEWLPELARALGAKPPLHLPAWLGRLAIGEAGLFLMTEVRGSSNDKAKRVLGWRPIFASWRDGFRNGLKPSYAKMRQGVRI